jgi:hypothetical protein
VNATRELTLSAAAVESVFSDSRRGKRRVDLPSEDKSGVSTEDSELRRQAIV